VVAGKHDLRYFESSSQKREISEIIIHPDWNTNAVNFDADVAVVTMKYPVFYTSAVQPICLPNYNSVLIHPLGTVVGQLKNIFQKFKVFW
jgi:Trypsin